MASIEVNALVGSQEMQINLDRYQWTYLKVDGEEVPSKGNGYSKTVKLTQGVKVSFVAKANSIQILNPNVDLGVNGTNYDGYWLTIDYSYTSGSNVELKGTLEYRNGYIHDAKTNYGFSQGKMMGGFNRVES